MFATPLYTSDSKLIEVPIQYTRSAEFFKCRDSFYTTDESNCIEVPFTSTDIENAITTITVHYNDITEMNIPTSIEGVDSILRVHDYFQSSWNVKIAKFLAKKWMTEQPEPYQLELIREWITEPCIAAALLQYKDQILVNPTKEDREYWANISRQSHLLLSIEEYLNIPFQRSRVNQVVEFLNIHWDNSRMHDHIKRSDISGYIKVIYTATKFNRRDYDQQLIDEFCNYHPQLMDVL